MKIHSERSSTALSIVATLYRSEATVSEFCRRAAKAARAIVGERFEIVLVNDGSPDQSLNVARGLIGDIPQIKIIDLSRNFGHHKAMMTGLMHSTGSLVFLIDSDLEEDPELLDIFNRQLIATQADVVYGVQQQRKGAWFERASGSWFYFLFNAMAGIRIPTDVLVVRLMTRQYVEALILHDEREVFMAGLWELTGFLQIPQFVKKHSKGTTSYSLRKKISLLVNAVTSFSNVPLYLIFYFGLTISALALIYVVLIVVNFFVHKTGVDGWSSLIASVWLLGGLIISFVGVIGIYLAKVFAEAKRRPYTIVRRVYGGGLGNGANEIGRPE